MWKEYSYDELEGVVKVGDKIMCDGTVYDVTDVGDRIKSGLLYISSSHNKYKLWVDDKDRPWVEGDIIVNKEGDKRVILATVGRVIVISFADDFIRAKGVYTQKELELDGWSLQTEPEKEVMTKKQAEKKFGIIIKD